MADLIRYLPDYYEDVDEFIEITDAENPEIDKLWENIQLIKANQFIMTSDEKKLRQWEKLLNIRSDPAAHSLDYRKAVIIMRLSTRIPLTHRWLDEKLLDVFGKENYKTTLNYDAYSLVIRVENDVYRLADEFYSYLRVKIPANLCLTIESFFKIEADLKVKVNPYMLQVREQIVTGNNDASGVVESKIFTNHYISQLRENIMISSTDASGIATNRITFKSINTQYCRLFIS